MKKIFQWILLVIFVICVAGLGFFAYRLSTNTLVLAFHGEENQVGTGLTLAIDRPGNFSRILPASTLLDIEAIKNSLFYNGSQVASDELHNFEFNHTDDTVTIVPKRFEDGDTLVISAKEYSKNKQTHYELPSDIVLHLSSENSQIITDILPSKPNSLYVSVTLSGTSLANVNTENITWYGFVPKNSEKCFSH